MLFEVVLDIAAHLLGAHLFYAVAKMRGEACWGT